MMVADFLREGGTLVELEARHFIKAKRHGVHPNLVLLKYNQLSSPFQEPLVRECRGLILDEADDWRPVALGFAKFFNHGEQLSAEVDWSTARVQEKLDGSLCVLYPYRDEWLVATTGTPDASGPCRGNDFTFAELFWRTFKGRGLVLPESRHILSFELTSPFNRVVVPLAESQLTLIGVRDQQTWLEEPVSEWADRYPVVREFPLQSLADLISSFENLRPLEQEGYVVVDGEFNRVKVKHPGYVAIHHMKGEGGPTLKRMLDIARSGEGSELLANFPEWRPQFDEAKRRLDDFVGETERDYRSCADVVGSGGTQKEFALLATKTRCPAALFMLRAGKVRSVGEFAAKMRLEALTDVLGIRPEVSTEAA